MSHSLLFYLNLSVTWMDFSKSVGENTKEGKFPTFSCTGSPSRCPGQGTDTPRTKTSLAGVCACFTHLFPHTGSPAHTLVALCTLSQLDRLAHPRGAQHSVALQTAPAAPAAGTGAAQTQPGLSPRDTPSTGHKAVKTIIFKAIKTIVFIYSLVFVGVCGLKTLCVINKRESAESWELRFAWSSSTWT